MEREVFTVWTATKIPVSAYDPPPGSTFPLGETVVTATSRDAAGNVATCQFSVRVRDTTAPALACPGDVRAETTGDVAEVTLEAPVATDAVTSQPVIVLDVMSGPFDVGATPVHVTVTDAAGNVSSCTYQVIVERTAPASAPSPSAESPAGAPEARTSAARGTACTQGGTGAASLAVLALALRRRRCP